MRHRITAFATLVLLGTIACSSSDSPTDPEETGGTFTATVDGQTWTGQIDALASYYNGFVLSLLGADGNTEIGLVVQTSDPDITLPGTVDLTDGSTGAQVEEGGVVWYAGAQGGSGTLTVTELTESRATGSFSFVAAMPNDSEDTRSVTNGTFDVRF